MADTKRTLAALKLLFPDAGEDATCQDVRDILESMYIQTLSDNIEDPSTQLNAIAGVSSGTTFVIIEDSSDSKRNTLYLWKNISITEDPPYVVDGSSGQWYAIAGTYVYKQAAGAGVWKDCPIEVFVNGVVVEDEFTFLDTQKWDSLDDGATGTNTLSEATNDENGVAFIKTDAEDNDYHYMVSKAKFAKLKENKPIFIEFRKRLEETNIDAANWIVGLTSNIAADNLQNDGGGLTTGSFSRMIFFKTDGDMKIKFGTCIGLTVTNQEISNVVDPFVSNTWYKLGIKIEITSTNNYKFTPYVNGVAGTPHTLNTASAIVVMGIMYGVKAGGANAESLKIDKLLFGQER